MNERSKRREGLEGSIGRSGKGNCVGIRKGRRKRGRVLMNEENEKGEHGF